jgi:hypothetical protein
LKTTVTDTVRTTIALNKKTKAMLDRNRAPGQCYDGFLRQMLDYWEKIAAKETTPGNLSMPEAGLVLRQPDPQASRKQGGAGTRN